MNRCISVVVFCLCFSFFSVAQLPDSLRNYAIDTILTPSPSDSSVIDTLFVVRKKKIITQKVEIEVPKRSVFDKMPAVLCGVQLSAMEPAKYPIFSARENSDTIVSHSSPAMLPAGAIWCATEFSNFHISVLFSYHGAKWDEHVRYDSSYASTTVYTQQDTVESFYVETPSGLVEHAITREITHEETTEMSDTKRLDCHNSVHFLVPALLAGYRFSFANVSAMPYCGIGASFPLEKTYTVFYYGENFIGKKEVATSPFVELCGGLRGSVRIANRCSIYASYEFRYGVAMLKERDYGQDCSAHRVSLGASVQLFQKD